MTRIISGFAGSLTLKVPSAGTRPTSDRVREALFSALEARDVIAGARVLDLYAGSGALALEAISRGAASAVLVEKSYAAVQVCKANAALVERYLGGSGSRLARWLLGRRDEEVGLRITPQWLTSWDFSARMGDVERPGRT